MRCTSLEAALSSAGLELPSYLPMPRLRRYSLTRWSVRGDAPTQRGQQLMRLGRLVRLVPLTALLLALVVPSPAAADHCGAGASVSPSSGPPGTTFVFTANLGTSSDLRVYRNDDLVKEVFIHGGGDIRYEIETAAGDAGEWRVRAELPGRTDCAAVGSFTVLGSPDTSIAIEPSSSPVSLLLISVVAGIAALGIVLRRLAQMAR